MNHFDLAQFNERSSPSLPSTRSDMPAHSLFLASHLTNSLTAFASSPLSSSPTSAVASPDLDELSDAASVSAAASIVSHALTEDSNGMPGFNLEGLQRFIESPTGIENIRLVRELDARLNANKASTNQLHNFFSPLPPSLNIVTPPPDKIELYKREGSTPSVGDPLLLYHAPEIEADYPYEAVKLGDSHDDSLLCENLDRHLSLGGTLATERFDPTMPDRYHHTFDTSEDVQRLYREVVHPVISPVIPQVTPASGMAARDGQEEPDGLNNSDAKETSLSDNDECKSAGTSSTAARKGRDDTPLPERRRRKFCFLSVEPKIARRTRYERAAAQTAGRGRAVRVVEFEGARFLDVTSGSANEKVAKACVDIFQRRLRSFGQLYCSRDSPAYLPGLPSHHPTVDLTTVNVSDLTAEELLAAARTPFLEHWRRHLENVINPSTLVVCAPNGFPLSRLQQIVLNEDLHKQVLEPLRGHHICRVCNISQLSAVHLAAHYDQHDPHDLGNITFCPHPNCVWSLIGFSQISSLHRHLREMHKGSFAFCRTCGDRLVAKPSCMESHFQQCSVPREDSYDVFANSRHKSHL